MRVLFVNEKLGYSSTTTYSFDLVRSLAARGLTARLCTGGGELRGVFRGEGIESFLVKYNYFSFRKLMEFLHDFDPQLIHSLNLRSMPMALRLAERLDKPVLVTVHHVTTKKCAELSTSRLAGVIAVNEAVRESLVNVQKIPKEIVRVIRSGVAIEKFVPGELPFADPVRVPVVGAIGRLDPLKGFEYLVEAARKVLDRGIEAMFVICGEGRGESALRRRIHALELEKAVTLCPPLPDLPELIRNFDVVVVPTLRGGVGLTALEAMAMSRPVVASAVGEILQLITDDRTGLLVPERDADALADRIARLIENPERARELGAAGRQWVEENYDLTPMVDATREAYAELLEEREGVRAR